MISNERVLYDAETKQLALERIRAGRTVTPFTLTMEAGMRFRDDEYVLATLETMVPQKEFLKFPLSCVEDALIEAAESDHWYSQEKVFCNKYEYEGEDESEDEDDNM